VDGEAVPDLVSHLHPEGSVQRFAAVNIPVVHDEMNGLGLSIQKAVLQIWSSKQGRTYLFDSEAFIYGPFRDVPRSPKSSQTVFATP
jgi:hypothetical protein